MESLDAIFGVHRDHEPMEIPLTRPSDTLSSSGGEAWGEGVHWFMESELCPPEAAPRLGQ